MDENEERLTKEDLRNFCKKALSLIAKEPKSVQRVYIKLIASTMLDAKTNEYEIAYLLGRKIEWVERLQKEKAHGRVSFIDLVDGRVRNGRHRATGKEPRVSKEKTFVYRHLMIVEKLFHSNGKPRSFNARGAERSLTKLPPKL